MQDAARGTNLIENGGRDRNPCMHGWHDHDYDCASIA